MTDAPDYRDTVFLPKTDFPMKAGLPAKEPIILAKWQEAQLYEKLRDSRRGREKFILHDGPPYANGDMHIGHALNHILKDMVCRTQSLLGKDAPYVPGWDCHGLPIEWKVEEAYRKKKLNKDEVPAAEFRAECRAYAQAWVDTQREQLKRLGINGDWDHPYLTMDFAAEATIVSELMKFAERGQLYRGAKPVMWSPVEKTALAEAEVEYEDIISTQIDVAFEITTPPPAHPELKGAYAVIWTTTPWTIPVNQAIAYGPDVKYVALKFEGLFAADAKCDDENSILLLLKFSDKVFLIAESLEDSFKARFSNTFGVEIRMKEVGSFIGSDLEGAVAQHPKHKAGEFFERPRPFLPGEFVTTEQGTGLVHMAPDHGEDDFELCKANGIEAVFAVEGDGKYRADWAWLGGQGSVINPKFNAPDGPICEDLRTAGALLAASADYKHSYPHSWRSKAKVIFRATPQWFIPVDLPLEGQAKTLRQTALAEIDRVRFVPEKGRNRIGAMVEGRPDWVISRQRAWGVPITLFVDRKTGHYLVDPQVNARIVAAIREKGVDAWTADAAQDFLGTAYNAADYEQVTDILDVWFDSGCTHAFVLESGKWPDLQWPADLYLEGSDQHRGWFQSSLLQSCGTRGRAPYDTVLTHGFTMDAKGMKMSKSVGNTIDPLKVMETNGADIIRLWALSVDFTEDHRIGDEILKGVADQYRKLRNTFRYLLGALDGFDWKDAVSFAQGEMPELECYILHLLAELDGKLRAAIADYDFNSYTRLLSEFANNDLSAFYFDIRKDSLYCDGANDMRRRANLTVLTILFDALVRYAAPVLVFTAEEVWQSRYPDSEGSVHMLEMPNIDLAWRNPVLNTKWNLVRSIRNEITGHLEPLRRDKIIGSSLQADVSVRLAHATDDFNLAALDWAEIAIVSAVDFGLQVPVEQTEPRYWVEFQSKVTDNHKCGRCWRHLPEVSEDGALCGRCADVVSA
jgi:isoleucyl-tRNA synthetase